MESIELELEDDELFKLMQLAHDRDITLNQLVNQILEAAVQEYHKTNLDDDDDYSFKTAGFGTDEDYNHHDLI